jgi:hypothetical protein
VARTVSQLQGVISYDRVIINDGQGYSTVNSAFKPPVDDFYWLHVSVGGHIGSKIDVYSVGASRLSQLVQSSSTNDGVDTLSRDEIFSLSSQCASVQV